MKTDISATADQINVEDIRTVLADIERYQDEIEDYAYDEYGLDHYDLDTLSRIADEVDGSLLVNEDYFQDYIQQEFEDIHGFKSGDFPFNCIDWEQAAEQARTDYSMVEFQGTTFYWR